MKSKKIIIAIVIAIALIGFGAFLLINNGSDDSKKSSSSISSQSSSEESSKGSLQSLASSNKAQECTMSYSGANGSGTGTMYSDGAGKARMQLSLTTEKGNAGESNQVIKDNKAYSWFKSGEQTIGLVVDLSKTQQTQSQTSTANNTPSASQNFDIKCKPWNVDKTKFLLPEGVNFMDTSNLSIPTNR